MEIIEEIKIKWKSKIDQISTLNPGDVVIMNNILQNLTEGKYFYESPTMKAPDTAPPELEVDTIDTSAYTAPIEIVNVTKPEPTEKELLEAKIAKLQKELKNKEVNP